MRIVGIVAEFNPFHNGHAYLIKKAKEKADADHCIVIMSGAFTQRGAPAYMHKYDRVRSALCHGADVCLELPVSYATATAEVFAYGAVSALSSLGVTDCIAFGAECDDISKLTAAADALCAPDDEIKALIQKWIEGGLTYPAARARALPEYTDILSTPNNILAIEYLKALKRLDSKIVPLAIKRIGNAYHDDTLSEFASAEAIRGASGDLSSIKESVPDSVYDIMSTKYGHTFPIDLNDMTLLAGHTFITKRADELAGYQDMNPDLANRMINAFEDNILPLSEMIKKMRTKELTYTRLSRAVLHSVLGLSDLTRDKGLHNRLIPCPYTRILGFRSDASKLMRAISDESAIPVINKAGDAASVLNDSAYRLFEETVRADRLYDRIIHTKYGTCLTDTCRISPIIYDSGS